MVYLSHAVTSPHGLLPRSLFFHVFLPHYFLGKVIVPYSPTPFPATLPLDALTLHIVVWHIHCISVSPPSCACLLLETAPECLLHHASKCIPYPMLVLCIHFLHTAHPFILTLHGKKSNLGSCIFPGCGACTCFFSLVSWPNILVNILLSCFPQSIFFHNKVWHIFSVTLP